MAPSPSPAVHNGADSNVRPNKELKQGTLSNYITMRRTCYRCGKEGHLARDCPSPTVVPLSYVESAIDQSTPVFPVPAGTVIHAASDFDTREVILDEDDTPVSLPMHYALSQNYVENDVFEVAKVPPKVLASTGCLWSVSSTVGGQQLLTV